MFFFESQARSFLHFSDFDMETPTKRRRIDFGEASPVKGPASKTAVSVAAWPLFFLKKKHKNEMEETEETV